MNALFETLREYIDEGGDKEVFVDAVDDLDYVISLLERAEVFVNDMVGIASAARPLHHEIKTALTHYEMTKKDVWKRYLPLQNE